MASSSAQLQANDSMNAALTKMNRNISSVTVSYERLLAVSAKGIGIGALNQSCVAAERMEMSFQNCAESVEDAKDKQKGWNASIEAAKGKVTGLLSGLKKIGKAIDVKKLVDMSNEFAQSEARLSLIVDDNGSVDALRGKIYAAAQASGADYASTMNTVARLGQLAGDAFGGNDELVRFTELMNKGFAIGGVSSEKQSGVMDTITKAMASGGLDSGAYADIVENAPILAESIETYMRASGVTGTLEEWMSKGMLTAEVIKNAMFLSADTIDARFGEMPKTWGGMLAYLQNGVQRALEPVLQKINELANNPMVQTGVDMLINGFVNLVLAALQVFEVIAGIAAFVQDNWSTIEPIIWGIVAALVAYKVITLLAAVAEGVKTAATLLAAGAQAALNAVMTASPVTWIIAAIVVLIALLVIFFEQVVGGVYVVGAFFANLFATIGNFFSGLGAVVHNWALLLQNICEAIKAVFFALLHNIGAAFINTWLEIQLRFWSFVDVLLTGIKSIADFVNKVLGVFGIEIDTSGLEQQINWIADKKSALEGDKVDYEDLGAAWKKGMQTHAYEDVEAAANRFGQTFQDGWVGEAFAEGSAVGKGIKDGIGDLIGGLFSGKDGGGDTEKVVAELYGGSGGGSGSVPPYEELTDNTGDIAGNTGAIAENTAKSGDDLKLLREIAEREAINRFTTAEVKVDMTGMSNTIASDMDIDGFINIFTQRFEAALVSTAEGVHV